MNTPTDSISRLPLLGPEYFEPYYNVVSRTLGQAKGSFTQAALGSELLELLNRQLGAMNAKKAGYDLHFDVRREAWEMQGIMMHNFNILEKRNIGYKDQLKDDFDRFERLIKEEYYLGWLTDAGRAVVSRPMLLAGVLKRELACIPTRGHAMRAVIITAGEAVKGASPGTFEFALKSLVESFLNYYLEGVYLRKQLGPEVEKHLAAMFEVYDTIDARRAAIKAQAEQDLRDEAEAQARRHDEEDSYSEHVRHTPADTYSRLSDDDDYWRPSFNPANGLPMSSGGYWDVMGNAYGTDFNHL